MTKPYRIRVITAGPPTIFPKTFRLINNSLKTAIQPTDFRTKNLLSIHRTYFTPDFRLRHSTIDVVNRLMAQIETQVRHMESD